VHGDSPPSRNSKAYHTSPSKRSHDSIKERPNQQQNEGGGDALGDGSQAEDGDGLALTYLQSPGNMTCTKANIFSPVSGGQAGQF